MIRLLRDLVLVKLAPVPQTHGEVLLAPALPPVVTYGKVVQVGPRVAAVAVGDVVAFSPEAGDPLTVDALPHLIIPEGALDAQIAKKEAQSA